MRTRKIFYLMTKLLSDKWYLQLMYYYHFKHFINFKNPKTFNEKLQWLKLYDRRPEYTLFVDKIEVKDWVAKQIGYDHIIPTLGIWNDAREIDFNTLPNQFVLKTNHSGGSSGVIICKDKAAFNKEAAIRKLNESLQFDTYLYGREWPYKNVKRRILAEKFISEGGDDSDLKDYKYYCFGGKAEFMFISSNRNAVGKDKTFDYFDMDFNHLPFSWGAPVSNTKLCCPPTFGKMKEYAEKLSTGLFEVRVDFYDVNGQIYFGELTFYDGSGFVNFTPEKWDIILGNLIKLPL